jgi:chromosome segregation ATPase
MTIENLSRVFAEAEAALAAAKSRHQEAADHAGRIRARLAELNARKAELHAARVNGHANANCDEEIVLLTGDASVLADALVEAEKAIPGIFEEQAVYDQARHELSDATNAAKMEVLKARARECDALLCRLLAEIEEAGGGQNLCQLWRPSRTLQLTIDRDFPKLWG